MLNRNCSLLLILPLPLVFLSLFILEVVWSFPPSLGVQTSPCAQGHLRLRCSATVGSLCSRPLCWSRLMLFPAPACVCLRRRIPSASLQSHASPPFTDTVAAPQSVGSRLWNAVGAELHRRDRRPGRSVFLDFLSLSRLKQEVTPTRTYIWMDTNRTWIL